MCFSATASFLTAGMTGVIGGMTLRRARTSREFPLAAMPLIFAIQQAAEGGLWLSLSMDDPGNWTWLLTQVFLTLALVIWPVYAPGAALILEPSVFRRRIMQFSALCGVGMASFFLVQLVTVRHEGYISGHHILYRTDIDAPVVAGGIYLMATALALLVSSYRAVSALGAIVFAGSVIAYVFYADVFVSVWCFFAAASSFVILAHFEVASRAARKALSST